MDPLPENLVPARLLNQCRFWDCRRSQRVQSQYCSLNHQVLSESEEARQRAVVVVDGFEMDEQEKLSRKILMAKADHVHCGVPELPAHVLQGNPWQLAELDSNRMEHESVRNWLFISGNVRPGNIWQYYDSRRVAGNIELRRIRFNLRPQPEGASYKVHQYSLQNVVLNTSVFWVMLSEEPLAKLKPKRAITLLSNQEPKKVCQNNSNLLSPPADKKKNELKHLAQSPNSFPTVLQDDMDLLNPLAELETRKHKLMDVKCQGCFNGATICSHSHTAVDVKCQGCFNIDVSHSQTVVVCGNCQTVLCQQVPGYKKKSETVEVSKLLAVEELESTKRLIEEMELSLDKAKTEEKQAKLRVEEMGQGSAGEASVATKALLETAQARHTSAISELESAKDELQTLQYEYDAWVKEKELAMKEADGAVLTCKEVERMVEEMPRLLQLH